MQVLVHLWLRSILIQFLRLMELVASLDPVTIEQVTIFSNLHRGSMLTSMPFSLSSGIHLHGSHSQAAETGAGMCCVIQEAYC